MSFAQEATGRIGPQTYFKPLDRERYRGVSLSRGRYRAQITIAKGVTVKLGTFDSAEQAATAFDLAAVRYRGPRARLNFPSEGRTMTLEGLAAKVEHMRKCQNDYFKNGRTRSALEASRAAEKEVDRAVREILGPPTLFGDR